MLAMVVMLMVTQHIPTMTKSHHGGEMSVMMKVGICQCQKSTIHHTPCWIIFWSIYMSHCQSIVTKLMKFPTLLITTQNLDFLTRWVDIDVRQSNHAKKCVSTFFTMLDLYSWTFTFFLKSNSNNRICLRFKQTIVKGSHDANGGNWSKFREL